jgi:superfamily II DNA or RNA helicase
VTVTSSDPVIEVGHTISVLRAPEPVVATVRHFVAYQKAKLPPIPVQAAIRAYFGDNPRTGGRQDVWAVLGDRDTRAAMGATGFDPDELDLRMVDASCRGQGFWDGWERLVTPSGKFPSGLVEHVARILRFRCGAEPSFRDLRPAPPRPRPVIASPDLYPFQREAVSAFLSSGQGVVDLPPRSGKTRIAVAVVAETGFPTLFVAPNKGLARQTAEVFAKHFGEHTVALLMGGEQGARVRRRLPSQLVWVATPQTAAGLPGIESRHLLVIDEFHHAAADIWKDVAARCTGAWWRLGLTGTHFRADGRDMEMAGVIGRSVYSRTVSDMVALGRVVPARIAMLRVAGDRVTGKGWYREGVVESDNRNRTLIWATNQLIAAGKRVLCLVKQVDHGRAIVAHIPGAVFVSGESGEKTDQALAALERRQVTAVVGTSVIGEGRDVPAADALVYFAGGKSEVKHTQDYYRVLTAAPGKRHGIVVDAADTHSDALLTHSAERLQHYREEACFTAEVMDWPVFPGWLAKVA